MKNNIVLKILAIIAVVVVLFWGVTSAITELGNKSNMKKVENIEGVKI